MIDDVTERSAVLTRSLLGLRPPWQAPRDTCRRSTTSSGSMRELLTRTMTGVDIAFELDAADARHDDR